jgi:hypothetical protein
MPPPFRLPIGNAIMGSAYTAAVTLGQTARPANLLVDTGSAMLVIDGQAYDPATDPQAVTSQLLQTATYASGSFLAAVVRTTLAAASTPALSLAAANLARAYQMQPNTLGMADGVLGLAYRSLDTAFQMPADTTATRYTADQTGQGAATTLPPFMDQLSTAGLAQNRFALRVRRSTARLQAADPAADPANAGLLVLGGGADCADLYQGPITTIAVVHEHFVHVNLRSVQVGAQPSIAVPPLPPGSQAASTAIVDSGNNALTFDQPLYTAILASFAAIGPGFADRLRACSIDTGAGCDQTLIDLTAWPTLLLSFQAPAGITAQIAVAPADYWQFDAFAPGSASAMLAGANLSGQSILGLPLLAGYYVIFDRAGGTVGFASPS